MLTTGRRDRLDKSITALAGDSEFTAVASRLACLRGIWLRDPVTNHSRDTP